MNRYYVFGGYYTIGTIVVASLCGTLCFFVAMYITMLVLGVKYCKCR